MAKIKNSLSPAEKRILRSLEETGQAERILKAPIDLGKLKALLAHLVEVERFYEPIGGIVGYHKKVVELISKRRLGKKRGVKFHAPPVIDFSRADPLSERQEVLWGIEHLDQMAEIYPVGGAADRLGLRDEKSGDFLPAAKLEFCGKTLLEHLIADLQAREYLYYKIYGKQLVTPVAMMTSPEKDNHERIQAICDECGWFGRPRPSFRLFMQPLVPALNLAGEWALQAPMQLLLKPGGHGVIWRLAEQEGIFDWFESLGRPKALVRQINNMIAGVDDGLLAFTGVGCKNDQWMGFASCTRLVRTSEGINVLIEKRRGGRTSYCLTNIEYCDLDRYGLEDEQVSPWNPFSKYPANTNLLFVDLKAVRKAARRQPFPGMLINAKKMKFCTADGQIEEGEMLRLESTMQNIADCFAEDEPPKRTYLTYNVRHKTISPIKRALCGESLAETPEGCLYDVLKNGRELLTKICHFTVPELPSEADFVSSGPPFLFFYHPALGPLYRIIAQKIQKGRLGLGSELRLEIAELQIENLVLDGSLLIQTEAVMGHFDDQGILHYSDRAGKCRLKNVRVKNRGISNLNAASAWQNVLVRKEACEIFLEEGAEFEAENVTFEGPFNIHVPKNTKLKATQLSGRIVLK